jgi:hypothetical protein
MDAGITIQEGQKFSGFGSGPFTRKARQVRRQCAAHGRENTAGDIDEIGLFAARPYRVGRPLANANVEPVGIDAS